MPGKDITAEQDEELRAVMMSYQRGALRAYDRLYRQLARQACALPACALRRA